MSEHPVETFLLKSPTSHPNASTLSLYKIADTDYVYVGKTEEWAPHIGKLVCWVPPDSIVDTARPEFSFLDKPRVRAKKLRGVSSYGLLILAPDGLKAGDDAATALGVKHYEPDIPGTSVSPGEVATPPSGNFPHYDVDSFMKYGRKAFVEGEQVVVTEKLHGFSSKWVFKEQMYCGTRNQWKKEYTSPPNLTIEDLTVKTGSAEKALEIYTRSVLNFKPKRSSLWMLLDEVPGIKAFCEAHPGWCLYGEVVGNVKNYKYGAPDGKLLFRAFDIYTPKLGDYTLNSGWLDVEDFEETCDKFGIPRVPVLAKMPFDFQALVELAEGNTTMPGATHIREGVVVKPLKERWSAEAGGRVCFKIINPAYLEKN